MDEIHEEPEARVVVIGAEVEHGDALFIGPLEEAKAFVLELPAEQRADLAIVTPGRVYDPREL